MIQNKEETGIDLKITELVNLLDTEEFNLFVQSIKESPENATLLGKTIGTREGEILIIKSIRWGCLECVKVLVENGADVNADSGLGMRESIFLLALKLHEFDIALYLLNSGADPQNGDYRWHLRALFNSDTLTEEEEYAALLDKLREGTL